MPYIHFTTNQTLTPSQKEELKTQFGRAIELIPGKSEDYLMITLTDKQDMYFGGKGDKPLFMVEISIFGSASRADYAAETAAVCDIAQNVVGINTNDCYITYREVSEWGCGGENL